MLQTLYEFLEENNDVPDSKKTSITYDSGATLKDYKIMYYVLNNIRFIYVSIDTFMNNIGDI